MALTCFQVLEDLNDLTEQLEDRLALVDRLPKVNTLEELNALREAWNVDRYEALEEQNVLQSQAYHIVITRNCKCCCFNICRHRIFQ